MDSFDFEERSGKQPRNTAGLIFNVATAVVLLMTLCICAGFATIFINPQIVFNPFKPPTPDPAQITPTITPTPPAGLPPTWTPTITQQATPEPSATNTNVPISTQTLPPTAQESTATATPEDGEPTSTPVEGQPTSTPAEGQPTSTPAQEMPFVLHPGDPVAINNIGYPDLGCDWMGVAGRAFDLTGAPIEQGIMVKLQGVLDGKEVDLVGSVGMVDLYGPGSYEFILGDTPIETTQTLWVQLFDQALLPLSNKVNFDTYADCDKNLILINFNQVR